MSEPTEPRIPLLPQDEALARAEEVGLPSYMAELNVFRVLLHNPPLAKLLNDITSFLLVKNKLDGRLRELVIMRIGWVTGSNYEWTQHWRFGPSFGAPEEDLLAVRDWQSEERFGEAERSVLAATDETLETGAISAETWALVERHLPTEEERLELVASIGNWRLFSSLLRSLEVPLEEGIDPWPPDGRHPPGP